MTTSEIFTLLFAFLAMIISIIGIIQNVASTTVANNQASDANKTANKALEIAKLAIKENVLPNIYISYLSLSVDHQLFFMRNLSHGKATISSVAPMPEQYSLTEISGDAINYPLVLGYQSEHHFKFKPNHDTPEDLHGLVTRSCIVVLFRDELERNYILNLYFDKDNNHFVGSPSEVTNVIAQ